MEETISRPESVRPESSSIVDANNQDQSNLNLTSLTGDQQRAPESIHYQSNNDPNQSTMSDFNYSTASQPVHNTANYSQPNYQPQLNSTQLNAAQQLNNNNVYNQSPFVHPGSIPARNQTAINQSMHQTLPNTSVYARGYNQVQSYPYTNYNDHPQPNYSNYNPQYPVASHAGVYASSSSFVNPYNAAAFYSRPQFMNNNHLNSSLHQPHSIDLNDSLSRSFNGVPSNFALLNPPPLIQALPFLAQNNQLSSQINSWLADYNLWQETVRRSYNLVNNKNLIPLKFEKPHSTIRFGNSNQLIAVQGKSIFIQNIKPILIECGENTLINTWPGPLYKDETNKSDVIEYIKGQEKIIGSDTIPEYHYLNQEKSQIWQLLSMMIKQSGDLSSSELAEFLISKNESEFYTDDGGTELGKFRRFLLLGQKKNALDYARKAGLWGHSFALAYLISSPQFNEIMINSVNDFTDSTLTKDDPIFTLYRRLLQNLQKTNPKLLSSFCTVLPPSNLQQFTILLANSCEISPVLPDSAFVSEVLKLIVALRDGKSTFIDLNSLENFFLRNLIKTDTTKYGEELLFMNEIYEFCQKPNLPIIEIIPFKTIFAAKLYDYGLINQSRKYCEVITNVYKSHLRYMCFDNNKMKRINWSLIMYIIEIIESKIDKVLNDQAFVNSFQTTPISNDESHPESSPEVEEDESEPNDDIISNELDSELENLHLTNEVSHHQQPNKINSNLNRIFNQPPTPQPAQHLNLQHSQKQQQQQFNQPPQPPLQQRDRSDSIQSRQRTTSRTSSNMSNFVYQTNKPEQQQQQINQGPPQSKPINSQLNQQAPKPLSIKTNDLPSLSSLPSLPANTNLPTSNLKSKTESKPSSQPQPTFFVPKFSPSDNLPPIDFVSKPPIEPTNLLEETNDPTPERINNSTSNRPNSNQLNQTSAPPVSNYNSNNFNSTLNPPMAQTSQNFAFSPQVSPITSPVLNANQNQNRNPTTMNNMTMNRKLDDRQPQQSRKPQDVSSLDQTDSNLKNEEKSGILQW